MNKLIYNTNVTKTPFTSNTAVRMAPTMTMRALNPAQAENGIRRQ